MERVSGYTAMPFGCKYCLNLKSSNLTLGYTDFDVRVFAQAFEL